MLHDRLWGQQQGQGDPIMSSSCISLRHLADGFGEQDVGQDRPLVQSHKPALVEACSEPPLPLTCTHLK